MARCKARVSLCMIVRDEEQNLRECLAPVADLFDEIIIVDTGSRDDTKRIARQFTPHVYDFPWCDDFSAARNESLRHASGDWIFWLDADDRMRPEHVARLRELMEKELDERPRAFFMETVLSPAEANEEALLVTHIRLFRRSPDLHWEGRVHEQLRPDMAALGYEAVFTDMQIEHIGYGNTAVHQRKTQRKLRLLRMDYAVDPNNPSTLMHLAMTVERNNRRGARQYLNRLLEVGAAASYMRWVYYRLSEIALSECQPLEAMQIAERGLSLFPDDEQLLFVHASALFVREEYAAVSAALGTIIDGRPSHHMRFAAVGNVRTKLAPRMLGAVQRMQKLYRESESTLQGVLRHFPHDILSWYNLGLVYLDQGDGQKLAPVVRELMQIPKGYIDAGLLAALWYLRHGDPSLAGPLIDQLIDEAPQSPRPRMLRAEWLSRCRVPLEDQMRALHDVLRIQPANMEARKWLEAAHRVAAAAPQPVTSGWATSVTFMPGLPVG